MQRLRDFQNCALAAKDGEIGTITDFYFDDHDWTIRYVLVDTGGWLSGRKVLIPPGSLGLLDKSARIAAVHLTREQVEQSPRLDADPPFLREHEEHWHRHFGLAGYWGSPLSPETKVRENSALRAASRLASTAEFKDYTVHATDGDIGKIEDLLIEPESWRIEYLVVLRSWLAGTETLLSAMSIDHVDWDDLKVLVRLPREGVQNLPVWDGALSATPGSAVAH